MGKGVAEGAGVGVVVAVLTTMTRSLFFEVEDSINCGIKIVPARTASTTSKPLTTNHNQDIFRRGLAGCLGLTSSFLAGLAGVASGMAILGKSAPQK